MTTVTVVETPVITLVGLAADIFSSCSLQSPPLPTLPPEEEIIYLPVAPGVTYESLPEITFVDTSPDQIIGCINEVGSDPQGRLNVLFPAAISGDGVIEQLSNNIWVYDGTTWNNVGSTPGPMVVSPPTTIPPYNETWTQYARIRVNSSVIGLNYSLNLSTEIDALKVSIDAIIAQVKIVNSPAAIIALNSLAPQISISARVDSPAASVVLGALAPAINAGKTINPPVAQINLIAIIPDTIGRPGPRIFVPSLDISLAAIAPSLETGAAVPVPLATVALASLRPVAVGKLDVEAFDLFLLVEDDLLSLRNP
jgi:hypothetical protein